MDDQTGAVDPRSTVAVQILEVSKDLELGDTVWQGRYTVGCHHGVRAGSLVTGVTAVERHAMRVSKTLAYLH